VNVAKALDPANNMTLNAVEAIIPTGNFGPVGLAVTADGKYALVSGSEGDGDEDGGRVITVVDLSARKALHHLELAWGKPGFACPPKPISHAGPHAGFGCFTDTNGVVISPRHGGVAFTANGGTDDVSVIDVTKIVANAPGPSSRASPWERGRGASRSAPTEHGSRLPIGRARASIRRATTSRSSTSTRR
jgi:DNA-binding beta-propeller fold protein YncE